MLFDFETLGLDEEEEVAFFVLLEETLDFEDDKEDLVEEDLEEEDALRVEEEAVDLLLVFDAAVQSAGVMKKKTMTKNTPMNGVSLSVFAKENLHIKK